MQAYNDPENQDSLSLITPSPSLLGSRKNSMTSISSITSNSTLGDSRMGTCSSRTSSMCASITDGSPMKHDEISMNGSAYGNGQLNSQLASHESVDFRSLQFQTDNSTMIKGPSSSSGRRPGSSQSFTAPMNGWANNTNGNFMCAQMLY